MIRAPASLIAAYAGPWARVEATRAEISSAWSAGRDCTGLRADMLQDRDARTVAAAIALARNNGAWLPEERRGSPYQVDILASLIDVMQPCNGMATRKAVTKADGSARFTFSFAQCPEYRARHQLIKLAVEPGLESVPYLFGVGGRGRDDMVLEVCRRMARAPFLFVTDAVGFFDSCTGVAGIAEVLNIPAAAVRYGVAGTDSLRVALRSECRKGRGRSGPMGQYNRPEDSTKKKARDPSVYRYPNTSDVGSHEHAYPLGPAQNPRAGQGPAGLVQGSAASPACAAWIVRSVVERAGVRDDVLCYSDNLAGFASSAGQAERLFGTQAAAARCSPAGAVIFREPVVASREDGVDFMGYRISWDGRRAVAVPTAENVAAADARVAQAVAVDAANADGTLYATKAALRDTVAGFRCWDSAAWCRAWRIKAREAVRRAV